MNVTNVVNCIAPATNTCFYRLFEYYAALENTIGAISIAVGLFTTYIILQHSTKEMSTYKWFILHATIWDVLAAVYVSFLFAPVPLFPAAMMAIRGPLEPFAANGGAHLLFAMMLAFYIICASAVSFCFAYRHAMLDHDKRRRQRRLRFVLLFITIFTLFGMLAVSYENDSTPTNMDDVVKYVLVLRPHWQNEIGNCPIFGSTNAASKGGLYTGLIIVAVTGNIVINGIFTFLIRRRLAAQKAMLSERTYRMHRTLTIALVTQICFPLVCTAIPILSLIVQIRTQTINDIIYPIIFAPILLYHSFNAIATLYFSEPYRQATIAIAKRLTVRNWLIRRFTIFGESQTAHSDHRMRSINAIAPLF